MDNKIEVHVWKNEITIIYHHDCAMGIMTTCKKDLTKDMLEKVFRFNSQIKRKNALKNNMSQRKLKKRLLEFAFASRDYWKNKEFKNLIIDNKEDFFNSEILISENRY